MTKLIIGLGNPDKEYQNTRHNVGFMFLDYLAKKIDANDFAEDKKHNDLVSKSKIIIPAPTRGGRGSDRSVGVVLVKPLCYVNKSGEVVSKLIKNLKLKIENLIIVHDDLDIEFGNFKLSFGKNSGGHKGVESVMRSLKTKDFWRLRVGTAVRALDKAREQSDKKRDAFVMDFVLSKFSKKEEGELKKLFKEAYNNLISNLKF